MVEQEQVSFQDLDCLRVWNPRLSIWMTRAVGPRIIGLCLDGGQNLLAVLPEARIPVEGREPYWLRGGHRLWIAPERPQTTYLADDRPLEFKFWKDGVEVLQPLDRPTGIQKSFRVSLDENVPRLTIDHRLTNLGREPFELAPWAVTMLKPGGLACLPLQSGPDDPFGLWPNRQIVIWPYTRLDSPCLELLDQALYVRAELKDGALKVGAPNPEGWIAYSYNHCLFVKKTGYSPGENYPDRGASSQIYCSPDVIELETLGPLVDLPPGESIEHQEIWELYPAGSWPDLFRPYFDQRSG